MSLGVIMLIHKDFDRAEHLVRLWAGAGCPVVVHVDSAVPRVAHDSFVAAVSDLPDVQFSRRHRCEWGTWGLVAATQDAVRQMLAEFPDVGRVYLASGSCLPLRPIAELQRYLDAHPATDFIESATTADVPWTVGGLDRERFTLRFPFAWKKRRRLFDRFVAFQQAVGYRRSIPNELVPHMGSQWWCLTRQTLEAIQNDPRRAEYDRYFKSVWIPDESYYQTLARRHARRIESRSLTLSKFDYQGKPHIFFDDHAELLARSNCFVARKIWRDAEGLYARFPAKDPDRALDAKPTTGAVDRIFAQAVERRIRGRQGLYMQSRFPTRDRRAGLAARPYVVLQGFDDIFQDFENWLNRQTGALVHGHLFATDRVHFAGDAPIFRGGLTAHPHLRDYNPRAFLTNLIWNSRDTHQCFQFGPADKQEIGDILIGDSQASIWVVSGAWAIPLHLSGRGVRAARREAARLQRIEDAFLTKLRAIDVRARVHVTTLADFLTSPMEMLQDIIDELAGHKGRAIHEMPQMAPLTGLVDFLQELKNEGMHPFLTGEIASGDMPERPEPTPRKPYLVARK